MEVTILEMLNKDHDPHDEHHILRLRDSFIHKSHLCLVFELLSSNLYELIKQNSFSGLSTQLVKVFTAQLLDSLTVLKEARLIHCDLKPENILLKSYVCLECSPLSILIRFVAFNLRKSRSLILVPPATKNRPCTRTSSPASTDHQKFS